MFRFFKLFRKTGARAAPKRPQSTPDHGIVSPESTSPPSKVQITIGRSRREPCSKCGLPVFIAERLNVGKLLYHRTCFRCARCKSQLTLANYYETENGEFCCEICPDEEREISKKTSPECILNRSLSDEEKTANLQSFKDMPDAYSTHFETALEYTLDRDLQRSSTLTRAESAEFANARSTFFQSQMEYSSEPEAPPLPASEPPHSSKRTNRPKPPLSPKPEFLRTKLSDSGSFPLNISDKKDNGVISVSEQTNDSFVTKDNTSSPSRVSVRARLQLFENLEEKSDVNTSPHRTSDVPLNVVNKKATVVAIDDLEDFDNISKKNVDIEDSNTSDSSNSLRAHSNIQKNVDLAITEETAVESDDSVIICESKVPNPTEDRGANTDFSIITISDSSVNITELNDTKESETTEPSYVVISDSTEPEEVLKDTTATTELDRSFFSAESDLSNTIATSEEAKIPERYHGRAAISPQDNEDNNISPQTSTGNIAESEASHEYSPSWDDELENSHRSSVQSPEENASYLYSKESHQNSDESTEPNLPDSYLEDTQQDSVQSSRQNISDSDELIPEKNSPSKTKPQEYSDNLNPFGCDNEGVSCSVSPEQLAGVADTKTSTISTPPVPGERTKKKLNTSPDVKLIDAPKSHVHVQKISTNPFESEDSEEDTNPFKVEDEKEQRVANLSFASGDKEESSPASPEKPVGVTAMPVSARPVPGARTKKKLIPLPNEKLIDTPKSRIYVQKISTNPFESDDSEEDTNYNASKMGDDKERIVPNLNITSDGKGDCTSSPAKSHEVTNAAISTPPIPETRTKKKVIPLPDNKLIDTPRSRIYVQKISINPFDSDDSEEDVMYNPFEEDDKMEDIVINPRKKIVPVFTSQLKGLNPSDEDEDDESLVKPAPTPVLSKATRPEPKPRDNLSVASRGSHGGSTSSISSGSIFGSARKKKPAPRPPVPFPRSDQAESLLSDSSLNLGHSPHLSGTIRSRKSKRAPLPPSASTPSTNRTNSLGLENPAVLDTMSPISTVHLEGSSDDIQHEKDVKDEENRSRQYQLNDDFNLGDETQDSNLVNKSTAGRWKRRKGQAPSVPVPQRRIVKSLPISEIKRELDTIEIQQQGLEKQGVKLEQMIREKCEGPDGEKGDQVPIEVEDLILQLFELVNEKNELFRRQTELMYLRRQQRLEEEYADVEYQVRCLIMQSDVNKSDSDKLKEDILISRLVEIVERKNEIVDCLENDRKRKVEEDNSISSQLNLYNAKRGDSQREEEKKNKKKKHKTLNKIMHNLRHKKEKDRKVDVDKDVDESEASSPEKGKKKKFNLF
ncbi:F-actin-monooxygenase MICAL3 isoform X2 [Euwallacea fornicatus]|uniref:F-actin-monooxygenase MICAL3 isoform X2 n=1 Tax=Euwallacea fornicatus TaxID=995702 RepID=UPI00338DA0BC